jgi:hypothetical protein
MDPQNWVPYFDFFLIYLTENPLKGIKVSVKLTSPSMLDYCTEFRSYSTTANNSAYEEVKNFIPWVPVLRPHKQVTLVPKAGGHLQKTKYNSAWHCRYETACSNEHLATRLSYS